MPVHFGGDGFEPRAGARIGAIDGDVAGPVNSFAQRTRPGQYQCGGRRIRRSPRSTTRVAMANRGASGGGGICMFMFGRRFCSTVIVASSRQDHRRFPGQKSGRRLAAAPRRRPVSQACRRTPSPRRSRKQHEECSSEPGSIRLNSGSTGEQQTDRAALLLAPTVAL